MAAYRLFVAMGIVASGATLAGLYTGEAWNAADQRARLLERSSFSPGQRVVDSVPLWDEESRDLYGNPFSPAVGSYRIDAFGHSFEEHDHDTLIVKLRSPEG